LAGVGQKHWSAMVNRTHRPHGSALATHSKNKIK
jgi:hypothetical protein